MKERAVRALARPTRGLPRAPRGSRDPVASSPRPVSPPRIMAGLRPVCHLQASSAWCWACGQRSPRNGRSRWRNRPIGRSGRPSRRARRRRGSPVAAALLPAGWQLFLIFGGAVRVRDVGGFDDVYLRARRRAKAQGCGNVWRDVRVARKCRAVLVCSVSCSLFSVDSANQWRGTFFIALFLCVV